METVIYEGIPDCAREIRRQVFMDEQGFRDEFDEIDDMAVHMVMLDGGKEPVATCRVFWDKDTKSYVLGRLAVVKGYRGQNIGSAMVEEAQRYVRKKGGECIVLHAQCRAASFYRKAGFTEFGDSDEDEGCPHIWMRKYL